MAGLTFFRTKKPEEIVRFYTEEVGMKIWLEQAGCTLLKHGNFLLGFCGSDEVDTQGVITFFYPDRSTVDEMYDKFRDIATGEPKDNERYNIYNFFAEDPEGRTIEFQTFLHPLEPYMGGVELLETRRSVRHYSEKGVPEALLWKIFETCRYSPTSKNTQSYYFLPIRDKYVQRSLASERSASSAPIGNAPMAVAICSDPEKSLRHVQDGVIAAYHFMLAAWGYGLGTCWIADMDRERVKEEMGVPMDHYVVTVTPLGYPQEFPTTPKRKEVEKFVKILGDNIT